MEEAPARRAGGGSDGGDRDGSDGDSGDDIVVAAIEGGGDEVGKKMQ